MNLTDEQKIKIFKKRANDILPKKGIVKSYSTFLKIDKLLNDMARHFEDANSNIVEESERCNDSLILLDAFRSFIEEINPLFLDEWAAVKKGFIPVSRIIFDYLNEVYSFDTNYLKVFPSRYFINT